MAIKITQIDFQNGLIFSCENCHALFFGEAETKQHEEKCRVFK